jgi:hypothetical protein
VECASVLQQTTIDYALSYATGRRGGAIVQMKKIKMY